MSKARISIMPCLDGVGASMCVTVPGRSFVSSMTVVLKHSDLEAMVYALEMDRRRRRDPNREEPNMEYISVKGALLSVALVGGRIQIRLSESTGSDSKAVFSVYVDAAEAEEAADVMKKVLERLE